MPNSDWTKKEREWITEAKRLFKRKPKNVLLYVVDSGVIACKRGVPSCVTTDGIGDITSAGAMLSDMHDDNDRGMP
jgi:hypothetical protein